VSECRSHVDKVVLEGPTGRNVRGRHLQDRSVVQLGLRRAEYGERRQVERHVAEGYGVNVGMGDVGPFKFVPAPLDTRYPTPIWLAETEVPALVSDKLTVAPASDLFTILKESWSPATVARLAERGTTLCRKLPMTTLNWSLADRPLTQEMSSLPVHRPGPVRRPLPIARSCRSGSGDKSPSGW
jgi:hypothetical protein